MTDYLYEPVSDDVLFNHRIGKNYTNIFHRHDGYEIYLFIKGNINFYFENACFHLDCGTLIAISPNEFHRAVCLDSTTYERISINIKMSYVQQLSTPNSNLCSCFERNLGGVIHIARLSQQEVNEFIILSHQMQNAYDSNEYGNDILRSSYLSQLLIITNLLLQDNKSVRLEENQNIMPKFLADTIQFIDDNITENITLKMLSEQIYLNGTYISRQFKEHTGITLQKYIINKKISLAARYLADDESVTTACYMSGFKNYSNFIRTFTKQMGISPGKYRRNI